MSFWRCCSTMAGRSGETLDLGLGLGDALLQRGDLLMRRRPSASSSARIRWRWLSAAPCGRDARARARSARSWLSLTRGLSSMAASARPRDRLPASPCRRALHGGFGLGKLGMGFEQALLRRLLGVGDAGDLGLGFARLPLHGGQHLARLRQLGLAIAPKLAQAAFFALGRTQALARPPRRRPRAASAARRCASSCPARSPAGCARAGGWRRQSAPWAAATKPSQRHRSPSSETRRWPGLSCRCSRAPSARRTTPICLSRRAQLGRRCDVGASGSTPAGSAGSGTRCRVERQCTGASAAAGASRSSPSAAASASSYPDATLMWSSTGGSAAVAGRLQQLGERLHLGPELAGGQPDLGCQPRSWPWPPRRRPGPPPRRRGSAARSRRCRPSAAGRASAAAFSLEASGARPTISRVCASSAVSWRSSFGTCSCALAAAGAPVLWRRARASAAAVVSSLSRASAALRAASASS